MADKKRSGIQVPIRISEELRRRIRIAAATKNMTVNSWLNLIISDAADLALLDWQREGTHNKQDLNPNPKP